MVKYKRLSLDERESISQFLSQGNSLRSIALVLNRNVSTISREIKYFNKTGTGYRAWLAQHCSDYLSRTRNRGSKIESNPKLYSFIVEKLKLRWSPQQISKELQKLYPTNWDMQASHKTIYTYLYLLPKGELRKELISYLRQKKRLRKNRKHSTDQRGKIPDMISIHERPKEVEDRIIPGHWEGTVANILDRFEQKATPVYEHIQQTVGKAEVVGSDETSIKVNGKKGWFHTYQAPQWTFIGYHDSRGTVAQELFYPIGFPQATLVSDCLAMQLSTPAGKHQVCTDHLLRELCGMKQMYPKRPWPTGVETILKQAQDLKKQGSTLQQKKNIEQLFQKLQGQSQDKAPRKIRAFWKRMNKHSDKIFTFLHDDRVPADNNGSERTIRNVKVKQKVSGQFKTTRGARQYAMNRAIIDTLNKQGKNVPECLEKIAHFSSG
ncbi:MAG TPA: IS30 family transposase [Chitinophagaceae bacterium]|nr:IS30 family transposase [Chitinophagaceae bacterium]